MTLVDTDHVSLEVWDDQVDDRTTRRVGDDLWKCVLPRSSAARRRSGVQLTQSWFVVDRQRHFTRLIPYDNDNRLNTSTREENVNDC